MVRWSRRWYRFTVFAIGLSFLYLFTDFRHHHHHHQSLRLESSESNGDTNINNNLLGDSDAMNIRQFFTKSFLDNQSKEPPDVLKLDNQLLSMTDFRFLKNASKQCSSRINIGEKLSDYHLQYGNLKENKLMVNTKKKEKMMRKTPEEIMTMKMIKTSHKTNVYLTAVVHSAPDNFEKRQVIRSTWASPQTINRLNVKVVFLLGLPPNDTSDNNQLQTLIDKESLQFNDIVQGNFLDTYKNLTLKHLMGYKWILQFCSNPTFVMKVDDDAFVDTYKVVQVLRDSFDTFKPSSSSSSSSSSRSNSKKPQNVLACSVFPEGTPTKREGKWTLTVDEYPFSTYPAYCSGIAYFVTVDIIRDLYRAAHRVSPLIWIDDLFVTGILASLYKIRHQPLNLKFAYHANDLRKWLKKKDTQGPSPYMIGDIGHVRDWKFFMLQLWEKTIRVWR